MSHERYPIEKRLHVPFSHTIPSEPRNTGIGDNGDGMGDTPVYGHRTASGEAILIPGVNVMHEEAEQLLARGAIFPLEIGQPVPHATFFTEKELFDERGQSVGFDATTRPTAITGLTEPLPHGLDKPSGY